MPLLQGDIRFARSVNMADVPEGGGVAPFTGAWIETPPL